MKALRWYGKGDLRLENIKEPKPKRSELKIRIEWCGICGSELHHYVVGPMEGGPNMHVGQIMGHEFAGEIVEVGPGVEDWKEGDRVTVDVKQWCKKCWWCKRGREAICQNRVWLSEESDNGGFAEYICVPSYTVYKITDNMSYKQGAFVEPLAITSQGVTMLEEKVGGFTNEDVVAVVGAGPIGNLTMQSLKATNVKAVYVSELLPKRRLMAKKLGADEVFDPNEIDVVKAICDLTNGRGVDYSFECGGTESTLQTCIDITRPGGIIVSIALYETPITLSFTRVPNWELSIIGNTAGNRQDYLRAIDLIANGSVNVLPLITSEIKLDDIIEKGFKELVSNKASHVKILVTPR